MDVLCLGIITCDILTKTEEENILEKDTSIASQLSVNLGGDALNVAVNLTKMGMQAGICGKTGNDIYGRYVKDTADALGVVTKYISIEEKEATSTSVVIISKTGNRNFIYYPGATALLSAKDVDRKWLQNIKVLAIGSYFALPSFDPDSMVNLLNFARENGIRTVMDVTGNPDKKALPVLKKLLPCLDYFMPSYEEASAISGLQEAEEMAQFFKLLGAENVVIKLGGKGALGFNRNGSVYVPATPDKPVDTTGAGDCFVAGMIAAILHGYPLKEAMIFAAKAAGLSVTQVGATAALKSFEEIEKRYENNRKWEEAIIETDYHNL